MMANQPRNGTADPTDWLRVNDLYYELVDVWYGDTGRRRARRIADRLEPLIERADPAQEAILGQECRALVREVRGDLPGAIRHRLQEIRYHKRLLQITPPPGRRTTTDEFAVRGRDYAELADRYDLLAVLYHDAGQLRKAIRTLWQSRELCELHGLKFEGKALLRDYLAEHRKSTASGLRQRKHSTTVG